MGLHINIVKSDKYGECDWDYEHPEWDFVRQEHDAVVGELLLCLDNEQHPSETDCFRPRDTQAIDLIARLCADQSNPSHRAGHPRYLLLNRILNENSDLWITIL